MVTLDAHSPQRIAEVLVVDDDPALAAAVGAAVPSWARVRTVRDGYQALHAVTEDAPDVVVTELHLPGLGGTELVRRLHASSCVLRVIVVSHTHPGPAALTGLGVHTLLSKPVSPEVLRYALADALLTQ